MPEEIKTKALTFLAGQTPRVLIALATIGAIGGMQWFGKATDATTYTIGAVGVVALIMNYFIVRKEGGS